MNYKHIATLAFAFLAMAIFNITANADTDYGIVTADALNIRSSPDTGSTIIGSAQNGTGLHIDGKTGNWYIINYNGTVAYVCADYVNTNTAKPQISFNSLPDWLLSTNTLATEQEDFSQITFTPGALISNNSKPINIFANTYSEVPSYTGSTVAGEQLVEFAKTFIGTPYVYGGTTPDGFDCSGFVKYCYDHFDVQINRVACDQALNGIEVSFEKALPGDILCFTSSGANGYINHTGIYIGNGYFIHSPHSGSYVEIASLSTTEYGSNIMSIRRIFN